MLSGIDLCTFVASRWGPLLSEDGPASPPSPALTVQKVYIGRNATLSPA